jgi:hypothetical protein
VSSQVDLAGLEEDLLKYWKDNQIFEKSISSRPEDKKWNFLDGPPFVTGTPHYGSLLSSIPKDLFGRFWTMKGYRVRRVWGWDGHGLPIENKVENKLHVKRKKDIEEKQVRLKGLLEQLKTVYSIQKTEKPLIRFFEGKKGLLASRNEALASKNKLVRMIYPLKAYMNVYSEVERNDAHARRVNNQVKARILYTKDTIAIDDDHSRTATEVDETQFPLHADIALYDNKVRIASLNSKLTGVIIEDEEICKTMNSLFELAWVGARYLQSKKKK